MKLSGGGGGGGGGGAGTVNVGAVLRGNDCIICF